LPKRIVKVVNDILSFAWFENKISTELLQFYTEREGISMKITAKRFLSVLLILAWIIPLFGGAGMLSAKAKKPKLPKKVSLIVSKSKTIKINNFPKSKIKKTTWKVSDKKKAKILSKSKNKVKIKGLQQGNVKLTAKVKTKGRNYNLKASLKITDQTDPKTTSSPSINITTNTPVTSNEPNVSLTPSTDPSSEPPVSEEPAGRTLKGSISPIFKYTGAAITARRLGDPEILELVKREYDSITMENEMKPNAILSGSGNWWEGEPVTGNTSPTLPEGYIENIDYDYKDSEYMLLNFTTIDQVIEQAYDAGLKMRFHVLVWHKQTPSWFFREGYSSETDYVDKDTMNGRLEYYIRNIIHHIYNNTEHGKDVMYAWDVVNEYTHNIDGGRKSDWDEIYYPDYVYSENRHSGIWDASYVIDSFAIAKDQLTRLEQAGKIESAEDIKLFYNDYNEYYETDNIIRLIRNINRFEDLCDGVGMQMHLDVGQPTPGETGQIATTLDKFKNENLEMQITELDVTYNFNTTTNAYEDKRQTEEQQRKYYETLFKTYLLKIEEGANITGLTFWGLYDDGASWRREGKPLLFQDVNTKKPVYDTVLDLFE
jgi:endo-1,4-beta-xylanase